VLLAMLLLFLFVIKRQCANIIWRNTETVQLVWDISGLALPGNVRPSVLVLAFQFQQSGFHTAIIVHIIWYLSKHLSFLFE
jgi:hypothetical protein